MKRRYLINMLLGALAGLFALVTVAVFPDIIGHAWVIPGWDGTVPDEAPSDLIQTAILLRISKMFIDQGLLYLGIPMLFALWLTNVEKRALGTTWVCLKSLQIALILTATICALMALVLCSWNGVFYLPFSVYLTRTWGAAFALFVFVWSSGVGFGVWTALLIAVLSFLRFKRKQDQVADTTDGAAEVSGKS